MKNIVIAILLTMAISLPCLVWWLRRSQANLFDRFDAFEQKYPPLTDEEFLQRCAPGTDPEVAFTVRRIIAEQLCIPVERIYPDQTWADLLAD